jgi:hypothetical protein
MRSVLMTVFLGTVFLLAPACSKTCDVGFEEASDGNCYPVVEDGCADGFHLEEDGN